MLESFIPMRRLAIAVLGCSIILFCGARCAKYAVKPDTLNVYAMEANDQTVIIQGCGSQPVTGYTYCRAREGVATAGTLRLYAPPSKCSDKESCASFQIFHPDGSPTVGIKVPKGNASVDVAWKDMVKTDTFQKDQRGFWPILLTWKWVGPDDKEHTSQAEGEVRLRVYAQKYVPLHEVREDANFVWKWADGPYHFRMSTTGRASTWRE